MVHQLLLCSATKVSNCAKYNSSVFFAQLPDIVVNPGQLDLVIMTLLLSSPWTNVFIVLRI